MTELVKAHTHTYQYFWIKVASKQELQRMRSLTAGGDAQPQTPSVNPTKDSTDTPMTSTVNPTKDSGDVPLTSTVNPTKDSSDTPMTSTVNPSKDKAGESTQVFNARLQQTIDVQVGTHIVTDLARAERHGMWPAVRMLPPGQTLETARGWIESEEGRAWAGDSYCFLAYVFVQVS